MATKTKKKATAIGSWGNGVGIGGQPFYVTVGSPHAPTGETPGLPTGQTNVAPVGAPPVIPPAPQYSKDTPLDKVPLTAGDLEAITGIQTKYATTENAEKQNLYNAAMAYGDQGLINQYGTGAGVGAGGLVVNPNSTLSTIARNSENAKINTGKQLNRNNTFFSGLHLDALGKINDQAQRDTADAYINFKKAEQGFMDALAAAKAEEEGGIRQIKANRLDALIAGMLQ